MQATFMKGALILSSNPKQTDIPLVLRTVMELESLGYQVGMEHRSDDEYSLLLGAPKNTTIQDMKEEYSHAKHFASLNLPR